MKKEFAACAVGMELPSGHSLRNDLAAMKKRFEDLLDEFSVQKYFTHFVYPPTTILFQKIIYIYISMNLFKYLYLAAPTQHTPRLRNCEDDDLNDVASQCSRAVGGSKNIRAAYQPPKKY